MTSQIDNLEQNYFSAIYWSFYLLAQFVVASFAAFYINPIMALFVIWLSLPNIILPFLARRQLENTKVDAVNSTNTYIARIVIFSGLVDWKVKQAEKVVS